MTSIIPQAWPNNGIPNTTLYPLESINHDYPHLYHISRRISQERTVRDLTLGPKTSKRVSKTLSPDSLMKQKQRSVLKNGAMSKRQVDTLVTANHDPPPSSASVASYVPPANKKGLVIDRPYSYYRVAHREPQTVTKIASPFGPSEPSVAATIKEVQRGADSGVSAYYIHPSQSNPFLPPVQYQPTQFLHRYQVTSRTDKTDTSGYSIPAKSELTSTVPTNE
ncbi:hypothetical protein BGZ65_008927, partial [Modicella reniformis]